MQLKDKLFGFIRVVQEYFLIPFCLTVFIIIVLISICGFRVNPLSYLFVLYTGLIFGFIAFFLWFKKLDEKNKYRKHITEFLSPIFLISLLLITLVNLDSLIKLNLPQKTNMVLTFLAVFSGFVTFYANQKKINEIEIEQEEELLASEKRKMEFLIKFPKINKIPILGSIGKWVYKEDWKYIVLLVCVVIISFALRISHLDYSNIFTDESASPIISESLVEQGYTNYPRAKIFYLLQSFTGTIFQDKVFSIRLNSVIIGTILILLCYLLASRFSKMNKVILASLLGLSPILIAFSRVARMYILAYTLFMVLIFLLYEVVIFLLNTSAKKYYKKVLYTIPLLLLLAFSSDTHVITFQLSIFVLVSFIFLLKRSGTYFKRNLILLLAGLFLLFLVPHISFLSDKIKLLSLNKEPDFSFIKRLMDRENVAVIILFTLGFFSYFRKNYTNNFIAALHCTIIIIFALNIFFLDTYATLRYIAHLVPLIIIVVSYVIYTLYKINKSILMILPFIILSYVPYYSNIYKTYSGYVFVDTYADNFKDAIHGVEIDSTFGLISTVPGTLYLYQDKSSNIFNYYEAMWGDKKWEINNWLSSENQYVLEKKFICSYRKGYYFADNRRFIKYKTFPIDLKMFLYQNTTPIITDSKDVSVFFWDSENNLSLKKECEIFINQNLKVYIYQHIY